MEYYYRKADEILNETHIKSYHFRDGSQFSQNLLGENCTYYISHPVIWNLSVDLHRSKVQRLCLRRIWEF